MKKILLLFILLFSCYIPSIAQEGLITLRKDETSGNFYYEEVDTINNQTQVDIFKKAKSWIMANMKTGDNNIVFDDKEYSIVNSAAFKIDQKRFGNHGIEDGRMDFKFHVWARDGRYKFRIDNITYNLMMGNGYNIVTGAWTYHNTKSQVYSELDDKKFDRYLKEQTAEKLHNLIVVFRKAMATDGTEDKKNW
jgi:hypothetical protein